MASQWFRIRFAEENGRRFISSATVVSAKQAALAVSKEDAVLLASTIEMIALMAPPTPAEVLHPVPAPFGRRFAIRRNKVA